MACPTACNMDKAAKSCPRLPLSDSAASNVLADCSCMALKARLFEAGLIPEARVLKLVNATNRV